MIIKKRGSLDPLFFYCTTSAITTTLFFREDIANKLCEMGKKQQFTEIDETFAELEKQVAMFIADLEYRVLRIK